MSAILFNNTNPPTLPLEMFRVSETQPMGGALAVRRLGHPGVGDWELTMYSRYASNRPGIVSNVYTSREELFALIGILMAELTRAD